MLPFLFSLGTNELVGIKATCPVTCSQCMRSKWSSNDWLDFQGFIDSSLIYQKLTPRQWLLQLHRTKRKYQSNFHHIWSTFKFLRDIWLDINFLTIYGKMSALLRARKMSAPLGRWFYVKFSWEIFSVCSFLCTEQIRRFVETFARRQLIFWWALIICDRSLLGRWFFVPAHFLFLL